jgi:hypothetical protein
MRYRAVARDALGRTRGKNVARDALRAARVVLAPARAPGFASAGDSGLTPRRWTATLLIRAADREVPRPARASNEWTLDSNGRGAFRGPRQYAKNDAPDRHSSIAMRHVKKRARRIDFFL